MNVSKRKAFVLLAVLSLGVIGVWFLWHWYPAASQLRDAGVAFSRQNGMAAIAASIPSAASSGTPVVQRARPHDLGNAAGQLQAVVRRFKESSDCLLYHTARNEIEYLLSDERLGDLAERTHQTLEYTDTQTERYLRILRRTEASCSSTDQIALAHAYADAVLEAALLGDPDAQSCFVLAGTGWRPEIDPAAAKIWFDRYLRYAPDFMEISLERGDPYVATRTLYRSTSSPSLSPSEMDAMKLPDALLIYRAAKLASLRALPEQRARMERRLAVLKERSHLQSDAITVADEWAGATYAREFAGQQPINPESYAPCYSSPHLAR